MGLVENHRAVLGQDTGVRRLLGHKLDGQIGEEQVVIHDDDVALDGAAVHLCDEAAVKLAALGAGAGLGAGIELVPEQAVFRQSGNLGPVAVGRGLFPFSNRAKLIDLFQAVQHRLLA